MMPKWKKILWDNYIEMKKKRKSSSHWTVLVWVGLSSSRKELWSTIPTHKCTQYTPHKQTNIKNKNIEHFDEENVS